MLLRLCARFLVQNLWLVRARRGHTATLDDILQADLAGDLTHTLSVSSSGAGGTEEDIHLFKRQTLGFREEEVNEGSAAKSQEAEEDVLSNALVRFR